MRADRLRGQAQPRRLRPGGRAVRHLTGITKFQAKYNDDSEKGEPAAGGLKQLVREDKDAQVYVWHDMAGYWIPPPRAGGPALEHRGAHASRGAPPLGPPPLAARSVADRGSCYGGVRPRTDRRARPPVAGRPWRR
jgi:hypothetical protein